MKKITFTLPDVNYKDRVNIACIFRQFFDGRGYAPKGKKIIIVYAEDNQDPKNPRPGITINSEILSIEEGVEI